MPWRKMMLGLSILWAIGGFANRIAAQGSPSPSFRDVIDLPRLGSPVISPDGNAVAYTVRTPEWSDNRFDTEIWVWRRGGETFQLTRAPKGSSTSPQWSADGDWIGFLANRGGRQQLYAISASGGEAMQLTHRAEGVSRFAWAPRGLRLALVIREPESPSDKERKKRYGEFAVEDQEYRQQHLWRLDFDPVTWSMDTTAGPGPVRITTDTGYTVGGFRWSPDGSRIAFEHSRNPLISSMMTADISTVDVASGRVTPLVRRPGRDGGPVWSPDGSVIAFTSSADDTASFFYKNNQLQTVPARGGTPTTLAADFDEQPGNVMWTSRGISFVAWQRTNRGLFAVDPAAGTVTANPIAGLARILAVDATSDGSTWVVLAQADGASLPELYLRRGSGLERITDATSRLDGWPLGSAEVVSWPSRDGARIEGVLHKPVGFDSTRQYPLMVVIHGGPTGIDYPTPVPFYVYPIPQWTAKGALVLRPNYRGSAGYGEAFRSLNVRNLGVGDLWDVMSGVDALTRRGFVDTTRMGAMGWSQGGYISAFLTTNTPRFKAISVGAGISNWVTYYVSTDIHPFTRQYLKATPWDDPAIYAKTSPMTTIDQAQTPTLIQHGEFDRRVPTQNAYELFQGLQDQGVPTKLIIYKGFGHGISKPKEQLAAAWHNWQWFARYVWGEDVSIPLEVAAPDG